MAKDFWPALRVPGLHPRLCLCPSPSRPCVYWTGPVQSPPPSSNSSNSSLRLFPSQNEMTAALLNLSMLPQFPIVFPLLLVIANLQEEEQQPFLNESPSKGSSTVADSPLNESSTAFKTAPSPAAPSPESAPDDDILDILLCEHGMDDQGKAGTNLALDKAAADEMANEGMANTARLNGTDGNGTSEGLGEMESNGTSEAEMGVNGTSSTSTLPMGWTSPSPFPIATDSEQSRLPDSVQPVQYELRLTLDSETDIVQGHVQIELQCLRPTPLIRLNIAPDFLQLGHLLLDSRLANRSLPFRSISLDWRSQHLSLWMDAPLQLGHVYYLSIWFQAHLSSDGRGLTRRKDKERGTWLNSLFEPSFARRLFPCWDEPKFRSAFRLELWLQNEFAGEDYVALSGTEGQCQRWHANLTICQFEPTPPIPTYLFSLAVGRFRSVCDEQMEICIWRLADGREAEGEKDWRQRAELVIPAMAQFQAGMLDYLLAPTGARLHLLIVPMKINGMENFGLLNVRESLWPPPSNDTQRAVQRFEKTLFHEMAHQWFGNLVTMEWWDSIWLAESLTTFLSTPRPIVFDPSTDLSEKAIVDAKWAQESSEGGISAIPGIIYTKGAALMEMLDALIGTERMQRLLRQFLRLFQFQSTKTQDFLDLLGQIMAEDEGHGTPPGHQANRSMAVHFLQRWLHLPSHPIVFVDFDPQLGQICLSQTPKMILEGNRQKWPIPVWVECLEGTMDEQLLWIPDTGSAQLIVPLGSITRSNSTRALAFNRNHPVYYQLSIRNKNLGT